jgi:hypothetical protein
MKKTREKIQIFVIVTPARETAKINQTTLS